MSTRLSAALVAFALLLTASASPAQPRPGDQQITIQVGGVARTCLVHVPAGSDGTKLLPLVIALHGSPGTGKGTAGMTGFSAMGDKAGFIAAYPDGLAGNHGWNALFGKIPGGTAFLADDYDDVAFLRALIALMTTDYHADPARVYVCGHSVGAYMAYRAAVELADVVAAVGVVNGFMGIKSLNNVPCGATIPAPAAPISLMHIRGKLDAVPDGGQAHKCLYKSVAECLRFFVEADGCAATGVESNDAATGVSRTVYSGGKAGTEVELVEVANCGHGWPAKATGLSASQALWDFFSSHPKVPDAGEAGGAE